MGNNNIIRVGTRESKLALSQTASIVAKLKERFPEKEFETIPVKVHAEKDYKKPLFAFSTRGVFVKELEEALINEEVDLVVHSLKDLPTDMPDQLLLSAVLERVDPRDVLISNGRLFSDLPHNSTVATSSRRRIAQLKAVRPDLRFIDIRGNIDTRIKKHKEGACDAIVLAAAGLLRLGMEEHITEFFETSISLPAAGQAALAIECRSNDHEIVSLCQSLDDPLVRAQITAERSFLHELGGGCSVPVGALAETHGTEITITGCIAALDGSKVFRQSMTAPIDKAHTVGAELAKSLLNMGGDKILSELKAPAAIQVSPP